MHTPTGENEYISVNVSLFVIYIMYKYPLYPKPVPQSLLGVFPEFHFTILIVFSFKSSTSTKCVAKITRFLWKVTVIITHCVGK